MSSLIYEVTQKRDDEMSEGRRERNKRDKRERIVRAAGELFDARGFAAVTTQEISERADVAAGTLFRYASTKGELLLMVQNERFAEAVRAGVRSAARVEDPHAAVCAILAPTVALADEFPENTIAYQRELLFGAPSEQHRAEGLRIVADLECAIADVLADRLGLTIEHASAASRTVFAVLHLAIVSDTVTDDQRATTLEVQIGQLITGLRSADAQQLPAVRREHTQQ